MSAAMSRPRLEGVETVATYCGAASASAVPKIFPLSPRYFGSHRLH
jgi:hypothetical protein